ncbi:MurR/RpiR family transcriptional regulator [Castellaniella sp. GW247-6E4]|uniref:MurR/RpiR family transcriptional regulator n=1 Tax=Castellaniella sp. GW247-6E4 TaxID=3140380 RepID=UPI0033160D65
MQAPQSLDALVQHIQSRYKDMSPQFQIGARYLIDHPTQVSILSMRKIATLAGVQPATLVRLAQHLGYDGWEPLKSVFNRQLRMLPGGYADRAQALVADSQEAESADWVRSTQAQSANLLALGAANAQAMPDAIERLHRARRLHIAGFRSSHPAAFSLKYLCSLFRPDVYLLDNAAGTLDQDLRHLGSEDTLVIISFAPYSREVRQITEAARRQGCPIIALCDSRLAPVAIEAACVLTFTTHSGSFFPSTVAAQGLVEVLAQQLLVRAGARAVQGLARAEAQLHESGAYL